MTVGPQSKRQRGAKRRPDLEELEPREGLWRLSWSWFRRAEQVEERNDGGALPTVVATPSVSEAPSSLPKRRRGAKVVASAGEFRAFSRAWFSREVAEEGSGAKAKEPKRRRGTKVMASAGELRARAFAWFFRGVKAKEVKPAPHEEREPHEREGKPKRKRGLSREANGAAVTAAPDASSSSILRRRAFAWLVQGGGVILDGRTPSSIASPMGAVARAHLKGVLEAVIFASEHPLPPREVARIAKADLRLVKVLLVELCAEYKDRGFRLDEVAGGFVFRTSPAFAPFVREQAAKKPVKMTRAQIETLAIVAYRQPITRPEIDEVRGVDSGAVLKSLLERDLLRIIGKKDEPGRPMLYGTTASFLEFFGLRSLADLPTLREFTELSDESRRTFESELGEEPPDQKAQAAPATSSEASGLMGAEGEFRRVAAHDTEESVGLPSPDGRPTGLGS